MNPNEDPKEYLRQKFPDMKPVNSVPALFSINGFGLGMCGRRDVDHETGTYVKTHCITALFLPIFSLGAYRVADAEDGGWYFVGKERKSIFAKTWNMTLVGGIALLIGMGWWKSHTNSPEYRGARKLEEAADHTANGEHLEAAADYRDMVVDRLPPEEIARKELGNAVAQGLLSENPGTVVRIIEFVNELPPNRFESRELFPGLGGMVGNSIDKFSTDRPGEAFRIIEAAEFLAEAPKDLPKKKEAILEGLIEAEPENRDYAVALAGICESTDRVDEAFALLESHAGDLGNGEGARILGQLFLARGEPAEAAPLLERYIEPRLKKWRAAERKYQQTAEAAYDKQIRMLENNLGPKSFYNRYDRAPTDEAKAQVVDEYVYEKMQSDMAYLRAGQEYALAGEVVPVIMDLGISELQTAQQLTDPDERSQLLAKAEEHFLSLKDAAGESGEFKFFLGQVYYWSGKQEEGRKLFDDLLAAGGRDYQTLLTLSSTLREIGNTAEARSLAEEAYGKAAGDQEKNDAASQRALLFEDLDDQIAWLEKMKSGDLAHSTRLAGARASKAQSEGNSTEAVKQLKIAEDGWSKLPVSASTLNNAALVQFELFILTGDISHHEEGSRMMSQAVALSPDNSILLGNAASSLGSTALMQIVEGKLHPQIIKEVGLDTLRFLYTDEAGRDEYAKALGGNENFTKAMDFLERAILLSPNRRDLYGMAAGYQGFTFDFEALDRLNRQLESANFDTESEKKEFEESFRGDRDDEARETIRNSLKQQTELLASIEESDEAQRRHIEVAMAETRMSRFALGETADLEKEIAFLRRAAQTDPCVRHSNALVTALVQKACLGLAAADPGFAKLLDSVRRVESAENILILALTSETLRPVVLADPVAKEALTLRLTQTEKFPTTVSPTDVVIAEALRPDEAETFRERFEASEFWKFTERYLELSGTPWHPGTVVNQFLLYTARGMDSEAAARLDKARAEGVPLPAL